MDEPQAELIGEQMKHAIDLMRADIRALQAASENRQRMNEHRLSELERICGDHETRLRAVADGVTQFRTWSGLTSGGSSILAIAAFLKAMFGG